MASALGVIFLLFLGCNKDGDAGADSGQENAWKPDIHCPGDASGLCDDADGVLSAGAAAVTITPTCFESWTDVEEDGSYETDEGDTFLDCGCDRLCEGDPGYPGPDEGEGDDESQVRFGVERARVLGLAQPGDVVIVTAGISGEAGSTNLIRVVRA